MLKVMLTVDTELWPRALQWPDRPMLHSRDRLQEDYERCILGRTSSGDYGLPFLLETLCQHDLKGVFFVESLYASAVGHAFLERTVRLIHSAGQEPQLHVHTEWLSEVAARDLPRTYRQNLRDFNVDEQSAVIRHALANLRAAGASEVLALRAGNMGGNHDTLLAAKNAGLAIDMSFDLSGEAARSSLIERRHLPADSIGCPTIPLSCVEDYPGHYRPAQLTSLSFAELRHALFEAEREGWPEFVILLHSFELITRERKDGGRARPHAINISRWNRLCSLLSQHRDLFVTIGCAEVDPPRESSASRLFKIPRTSPRHTLWRMGEQLVSRIF